MVTLMALLVALQAATVQAGMEDGSFRIGRLGTFEIQNRDNRAANERLHTPGGEK